ncbi:MAG: aminoacyl-tRNA hydrolase [Thermoanaerobaculia bacterium]
MCPSVAEEANVEIRLIVGLGNPGERYRQTRHNLGFTVLEELANRRGSSFDRIECKSLLAVEPSLILARPQTYMNRSGYALRCLAEKRDLRADAILVVFDDVHLPLGKIRFRRSGGPGGHRGMESVIQNLQSEGIPRLRLGVGNRDDAPEGDALVDFVLSPFLDTEAGEVEEMTTRAADACECWLADGAEATMNEFNR